MKQPELKTFIEKLHKEVYPGADTIIVTGSASRGDMNPDSDVDVVVIYNQVLVSHSKSFEFHGRMVDANVHDPKTALQKMMAVERKSGDAYVAKSILDGVAYPSTETAKKLRAFAEKVWKGGPMPVPKAAINEVKATASRRFQDLKNAKSLTHKIIISTELYNRLVNVTLGANRKWTAPGRELDKIFKHQWPELHAEFQKAFETYWKEFKPEVIGALMEKVFKATGGDPALHRKKVHSGRA